MSVGWIKGLIEVLMTLKDRLKKPVDEIKHPDLIIKRAVEGKKDSADKATAKVDKEKGPVVRIMKAVDG